MKVRPTEAMIDIIVKIMVEVISILGIVTKELKQGRTSMRFLFDVSPKLDRHVERYLKKLFGLKKVEDALQRLDKLTQEEARMAAAEALTITHGIDDKVNDVDKRVEGVDEGVQSIGIKVEGIKNQLQVVDGKVEGVDHRVSSVIQGALYFHSRPSNSFSAFTLLGVAVTDAAIQQVFNRVNDLNRSWTPHFIIVDHECLTSRTGNELRKDLRKWIAPPDPSVNYNAASGAHHEGTAAWCTGGDALANWKKSGSLLWMHGKRTYPITVLSYRSLTTPGLTAGSGKSILRCVCFRGDASKSYLYNRKAP